MSPASSWPRILFPLWDSCTPPVACRPGTVYTSPWSKKPKFDRWHHSLGHLLTRWVFPPLSVLFPATDRMEENTTCAPDPSTSRPSALKSLLMALGLLCAKSPIYLPHIFKSHGWVEFWSVWKISLDHSVRKVHEISLFLWQRTCRVVYQLCLFNLQFNLCGRLLTSYFRKEEPLFPYKTSNLISIFLS